MKREALNSNSWRELVQRTMLEKDISYEEALEYVKQKFPEIVDEVGIDTLVNMDAPKDQQYVDVLDLPETETVLYSKNPDLQDLPNDVVENLEFGGIAKQIVNKWLCQALDKNDSKAVRNACIVLKAMGDDYIEFETVEDLDNTNIVSDENLNEEDVSEELGNNVTEQNSKEFHDSILNTNVDEDINGFSINKTNEDSCKKILENEGLLDWVKFKDKSDGKVFISLDEYLPEEIESNIYKLCEEYIKY